MSDQTMKLFEALSDVDEELLERCNREENGKIAYMPLWKYGKVMTACLCLIVVGALSFGGHRMFSGRKGSSGSGSDSAAPAQVQDMTIPLETTAGASKDDFITNGEKTSQYAESEAAEGAGAGDVQSQIMTEDRECSGDVENNTSRPSAGGSSSGSSVRNGATDNLGSSIADRFDTEKVQAQQEAESDLIDSRTEIPWDTACETEPFGSYLPRVIPSGYEPLSARQSSRPDMWNNMIFKWSNGEQLLYASMTVNDAKDKDAIKAEIARNDGMYQYPAEDFKREMIPEPLDGQIMFTLYYSDGMKIDFSGCVTADEMWELVKSVPK